MHLDPGIYTNIFQVNVPTDPVDLLVAPSSAYPDLRTLRTEINENGWAIRVYRARDKIFGYGPQKDLLAERVFEKQKILLHQEPEFCARCILEGLGDQLKEQRYHEWSGKGRVTFYESNPYRIIHQGKLRVYRGYDLRTIFWRQEKELLFGLIVDIHWQIQDASGRRLSPAEITQYSAMRKIAQIQQELLPTGQINTKVSRLRLQQHILSFVEQYKSFPLPWGGTANVDTTPMRVILGG